MSTDSANSVASDDAPAYVPKPALTNAATVGLQSGAVGLVISAVQNALSTHNAGAAGVLTRTGGTIGIFAAMGATFAFADGVSANIREKDDHINGFVGGCSAGLLAGLRARSIPVAVGSCALMGGLVATFDAAGSSLTGGLDNSPEGREERRRRFFKRKPPPIGDDLLPEGQT